MDFGMGLRIGVVSAVDEINCAVRVRFADDGLTSGRLKVVQFAEKWLPDVGDTVLCIYGSEWNSDGFVLGKIV